jgi:hypothetical protein
MLTIGPVELIGLAAVIAVAVKCRRDRRLGMIPMRTASLIVSWLFLVLGVILFFASHERIAGAILTGASIIAIAILQSRPPQPPESPAR